MPPLHSKSKAKNGDDDPKFSSFTLFDDRKETFKTWPVGSSASPDELARAGLFYTGQFIF